MHEQLDKRDEQIQRIKEWLASRKKASGTDIDLDMDLIDHRVLDSLKFMDFVLFLEELVGREISTDGKTIASLRTLRKIRDHVL